MSVEGVVEIQPLFYWSIDVF